MRNVLVSSALLLVLSVSAAAQDRPCPQPPANPWGALETGNKLFLKDSISFDDLTHIRGCLSKKQNPAVTVLSCSDSRVPPELLFKQNLGEIFLVRSAGNVTDKLGIASIEYAIEHHWTKLLVILAHQRCGAVEAAMGGDPESPNLLALVKKIRGSFDAPCTADHDTCWDVRTKENALHAVTSLKEESKIIREAIDDKKLPVVVAFYKLDGTLTVWQRIN